MVLFFLLSFSFSRLSEPLGLCSGACLSLSLLSLAVLLSGTLVTYMSAHVTVSQPGGSALLSGSVSGLGELH